VNARDAIELSGVRAYGRHGANPHERDHPQAFDLGLRLEVDLAAARRSDDLAETIDYAALHARILRIVRTESYALLERLGDHILGDIMRDERILAAELTIAKPRLLGGATPAVRLHAFRDAPGPDPGP
jgi:dihydroneopterin aldolase